MAPAEDNLLDKAEAAAKKLLERLGSVWESKQQAGSPPGGPRLSVDQISNLLESLQRTIDANLRHGPADPRAVAPNRLKVLLTYEETSGLSQQYMQAVAKELTSEIAEYMANRRYLTDGPIVVDLVSDVLAKETTIRHSFESEKPEVASRKEATAGTGAALRRGMVLLIEASGKVHRVVLEVGGSPAYVGRSSECAVRIEEPGISRLHCSLAIRRGGEVVVGDLGSANGTAVDGQQLQPNETRVINLNNRIDVGEVTLSVSGISLE